MTRKTALLIYSAFIATVFVLAYFGLIPTKLHDIPYYDSAGHFILYGLWGWFFGRAFAKPLMQLGSFQIPSGIAVVIAIAVVEESLQQLSPLRTFSLTDLGFGLLGILTACIVLTIPKPNRA